jgi:phosphohistidine phosphatase SixA
MALTVLYLVRHGKAEGSHPQGDRHRSLSAEGRARISAMLPQAKALSLGCDLAVSSPYLRAVQTRDLFAPAFSPTRSETSTALTPEADPAEAFDELLGWEAQGHTHIALYTHNPFVTALAGLVAQPSGTDPVFHTPTILALQFDAGLKLRAGRPLWTLHP